MSSQTGKHSGRRRAPGRLFHRTEGQAAFEFLLIFPFFILLVLLLVDFGVMMYEYVSVSNAVREGTRYAAVNCGTGSCTVDAVKTRTVDRSGGILSDPAEVTVAWMDNNTDGLNHGRGDSIVVKVDHPYAFLFFPATIPVVSCADMRLEQSDRTTSLPTGSGC